MFSEINPFFEERKGEIFYMFRTARFLLIVLFFIISGILFYYILLSPPRLFPKEEIIFTIPEGKTLSWVAQLLKSKGFISSAAIFKMIVIALDGEGAVRHGEYVFDAPQSAWTIARRIVSADFGLTLVKITIPEGATVDEMADIFEKNLTKFNKEIFARIAKKDEGYLFPDTYLFLPNDGELKVYRTLRKTFDEKIVSIESDIAVSGKELKDVVVMASLLEREARTTETRRVIAGILWKRLEIGMPLQVDAVFEYINGKNTFSLTLDDLKIDSPYNTYKYKGLPVGPIANPGMDSILAALHPVESPYFYYLSDKDGNIYYSRAFDEHLTKKARYLR